MRTARRPCDFYPTPGWATAMLLARVPIRGQVLECCAGAGAIASVLRTADGIADVIGNDPNRMPCPWPFRLDAGDPASWRTFPPADWVVTNPPFAAAERIVLCLAADPNDPDRRVLAGLKSNLSRLPESLAFRLPDGRVEWEREPVALDAEALLRPTTPADRDDLTDAEAVIRELLEYETWPLDAKQALAVGHAHGISERTMQRTAHRLGIKIRRQGFGKDGRWQWRRPPIPDNAPEPECVSSMASMADMAAKTTFPAIDDTLTFTVDLAERVAAGHGLADADLAARLGVDVATVQQVRAELAREVDRGAH